MPLSVHNNVPYLPDGACDSEPLYSPYPLWLTVVLFLGVFALLQWSCESPRLS